MSTGTDMTSNTTGDNDVRQLKLISVAFKEASLDSPSFRAHTNFFETRAELFHDWILKTVEFVDKKYASSFEDYVNTREYILREIPPSAAMISNGFLTNQSHTPILVEEFKKEYEEFIRKLLKFLVGKGTKYSAGLVDLTTNSFGPYKKNRMEFQRLQKKYDDLLVKDQEINISNTIVEPQSLMESSLNLFEVKKKYLSASLDLIVAISKLKLDLDKFLIEIVNTLMANNIYTFKETGHKVDLTPTITEYFKDHHDWMEKTIEGFNSLDNDMKSAKKQVFEYSVERTKPSDNLEDYNISGINTSALINSKVNIMKIKRSPEKSGWLYLKTTVGKPSRTIWVRKWCFIQNCVFGMFGLSPSKKYVEETDKFGILLINVRYDADEGRKFCFEIKIIGNRVSDANGSSTKDLTLTLQTESLKELKSWLTSFKVAQLYAQQLHQNSFEYDVALRRFSPEFFEFASSSTNSSEQLITRCNSDTKPLLEFLKGRFAEYDSLSFDDDKVFHFQMEPTPITTKMTQLAIFSHFYQSSNWLPSATIANIWGTTNWTSYSILDTDMILKGATEKPGIFGDYPTLYSNEMKINDIQFKSLFFSIDHRVIKYPNTLLLFKFSSFWCPNKSQRFASSCYITADDIFCFMNTMGFICLFRRKIKDIRSISVDNEQPNLLHFNDLEGPHISIYIYFTHPQIIVSKLNYLLENSKSDAHIKGEELYNILNKIELNVGEKISRSKAKARKETEESLKSKKDTHLKPCNGQNENTFWTMSEKGLQMLSEKKRVQVEYTVNYVNTYEIASKGLTHILFGDKSDAFPVSFYFAQKINGNSNERNRWYEEVAVDGLKQLVRDIKFQLNLTDNFLKIDLRRRSKKSNQRVIRQRIIRMTENRYYEIDQEPSIIKFPFCRPLRASLKYIITEPYDPEHEIASKLHMSTSRSILSVYYKLEYIDIETGKVIKNVHFNESLMRNIVIHFTYVEFVLLKKVIKYYLERIGQYGKVIKAIKLCGMFEPYESRTALVNKITNSDREKYFAEYTLGILFKIELKITVYRMANFFITVLRIIINSGQRIKRSFSKLNKTVILILFGSALLNVMLSHRNNVEYWSLRSAVNRFNEFIDGKHRNSMERHIILKSEDLLKPLNSDNLAMEKYNKMNQVYDPEYRTSRQSIASKRNQILIELRLLQNMEREIVHDDYEKFLNSEIERCKMLQDEAPEVLSNDTKLSNYCYNCERELERLSSLLL